MCPADAMLAIKQQTKTDTMKTKQTTATRNATRTAKNAAAPAAPATKQTVPAPDATPAVEIREAFKVALPENMTPAEAKAASSAMMALLDTKVRKVADKELAKVLKSGNDYVASARLLAKAQTMFADKQVSFREQVTASLTALLDAGMVIGEARPLLQSWALAAGFTKNAVNASIAKLREVDERVVSRHREMRDDESDAGKAAAKLCKALIEDPFKALMNMDTLLTVAEAKTKDETPAEKAAP